MTEPILTADGWRAADASDTFRAVDPTTAEAFGPTFPRSSWNDVDAALASASGSERDWADDARRAALLRAYADRIEEAAPALAAIAARETALPADARFRRVEIPRTVDQLRQAADSVERRDWQLPTIDTRRNIRSCLAAIGPAAIFGPANFPFAYNAIAGTDFASAIAAGCRLIARAHPSHPNTTKALAELFVAATGMVGLTRSPVELIYDLSNVDGLRFVGDRRLAAVGFTGSRGGGLALKAAADAGGVAFFGELSSVNPVAITAAALDERGDAIADEFVASALLAGGQMCTKPGLVFVEDGAGCRRFVERVAAAFRATPPAILLNEAITRSLRDGVARLRAIGAASRCGGAMAADGLAFENTLFVTSDEAFLRESTAHQAELFGNAAVIVACGSAIELDYVLQFVDANLTGSVYFATDEAGSPDVKLIAASLRRRVGRLLNNAMPTGVAVSGAMNHGGPWPASTSPQFSAVGFPATIRRFAKLECYDRVVPELLPDVLSDQNPTGATRCVDGRWTDEAIGAAR